MSDQEEVISPGVNTLRSWARYAEPSQTLIFLDWDDTVFPTTEIFSTWGFSSRKESWSSIVLSTDQQTQLSYWRAAAHAYLETARALSERCTIVTNAKRPWVSDCVDFFAPDLEQHLVDDADRPLTEEELGGRIRIIYARDVLYDRTEGRYRQDVRPVAFRAGDQKLSSEEIAAELTSAKYRAMRQEARSFYKKYKGQTWKNILSIGDSPYERDAVAELSFRRRSRKRERLRTKACAWLKDPAISKLTFGLSVGRYLLKALVRHDGDLDLDMSAIQDWQDDQSLTDEAVIRLLAESGFLENESDKSSKKSDEDVFQRQVTPEGVQAIEGIWHTVLASTPSPKKGRPQPFSCYSVAVDEGDEDGSTAMESLKLNLGGSPHFLLVHAVSPNVLEKLIEAFTSPSSGLGTCVVHGCTSCFGVFDGSRVCKGNSASIFGFRDPQGSYVSAARSVRTGEGSDPWREAAVLAANDALKAANVISLDRDALPLVLLHATAGFEEAVLEGISEVLPSATIFGGSAGHDTMEASRGKVAAGTTVLSAPAVALALLWPSVPYLISLNCVHQPASSRDRHTMVNGTLELGRRIKCLGGEPAAAVYDTWCDEAGASPHSVDSRTALHPLARTVVTEDGETRHFPLMAMPTRYDDGSLGLFAATADGEELVFLSGTREGLMHGMQNATHTLREDVMSGPFGGYLKGALVICCGGLAKELHHAGTLDLVAEEVHKALSTNAPTSAEGVPLHGFCALGEQGPLLGARGAQANLMFNLLVFYQD